MPVRRPTIRCAGDMGDPPGWLAIRRPGADCTAARRSAHAGPAGSLSRPCSGQPTNGVRWVLLMTPASPASAPNRRRSLARLGRRRATSSRDGDHEHDQEDLDGQPDERLGQQQAASGFSSRATPPGGHEVGELGDGEDRGRPAERERRDPVLHVASTRPNTVHADHAMPKARGRVDDGRWRARRDSNPRPSGPQPDALSTELRAHATGPDGEAGGEGGIRTLEAGYPTWRFSKPLH